MQYFGRGDPAALLEPDLYRASDLPNLSSGAYSGSWGAGSIYANEPLESLLSSTSGANSARSSGYDEPYSPGLMAADLLSMPSTPGSYSPLQLDNATSSMSLGMAGVLDSAPLDMSLQRRSGSVLSDGPTQQGAAFSRSPWDKGPLYPPLPLAESGAVNKAASLPMLVLSNRPLASGAANRPIASMPATMPPDTDCQQGPYFTAGLRTGRGEVAAPQRRRAAQQQQQQQLQQQLRQQQQRDEEDEDEEEEEEDEEEDEEEEDEEEELEDEPRQPQPKKRRQKQVLVETPLSPHSHMSRVTDFVSSSPGPAPHNPAPDCGDDDTLHLPGHHYADGRHHNSLSGGGGASGGGALPARRSCEPSPHRGSGGGGRNKAMAGTLLVGPHRHAGPAQSEDTVLAPTAAGAERERHYGDSGRGEGGGEDEDEEDADAPVSPVRSEKGTTPDRYIGEPEDQGSGTKRSRASDGGATEGVQPARARTAAKRQAEEAAERRREREKIRNRDNQARYRQRMKSTIETLRQEKEELQAQVQALLQEQQQARATAAALYTRSSVNASEMTQLRRINRPDTPLADPGGPNAQLADALSLCISLLYKHKVHVAVEELDRATPDRIAQLYQDVTVEFGQCLNRGAAEVAERIGQGTGAGQMAMTTMGQGVAAYERLAALINAAHELTPLLFLTTSRFRVTGMRHVRGFASKGEQGPVPRETLRTAFRKMGLSESQKQALVAARKEFARKQQPILAQRAKISQYLRCNTETMANAVVTMAEDNLQQLMEGSNLMRDNVYEESRALSELSMYCFRKVLKPTQEARLYVELYPWRSEIVGMCNFIMEEMYSQQTIGPYPLGLGGSAPGLLM